MKILINLLLLVTVAVGVRPSNQPVKALVSHPLPKCYNITMTMNQKPRNTQLSIWCDAKNVELEF